MVHKFIINHSSICKYVLGNITNDTIGTISIIGCITNNLHHLSLEQTGVNNSLTGG